ncbi:MAG: 7-cyano-7-deazaguanine synthase QueC [Bdellovibrionota bacterium]
MKSNSLIKSPPKKDLKSVVCLSAGLDSTVNLYAAHKKTEVVQAVTFNYGQKAAEKEIACAKAITAKLKIPHKVIELPWFKDLGESSLTSNKKNIPIGDDVSIDNHKKSIISAKAVWVPNRNGIFLNIAAGIAESLKADLVVPGFNLEEASTFPDNSEGFMKTLDLSLSFSTANKVRVHCYTVALTKIQIVSAGKSLDLPFEMIWPCYFAKTKWCGECESCQRAKRALSFNQVPVTHLFESSK